MNRRREPLASNSGQSQGPGHVQAAIRTGGKPLDDSTRSFFEPKFGVDLGPVRIHTGSEAAESAQALSAKAYALGNDVVFGDGNYEPGTTAGRHLLAHELAHVAQAGSSSGIHRATIYREPDAGQIMAEIQMLRMQLMAPVNPLRQMQQLRLAQLEAMASKVVGKAAPVSKPKPALDLPFEFRFASAWDKAKTAAQRKVRDKDEASYGGSLSRNLMKIGTLAPSAREVWKAGVYGGLFRNDEWTLVEARANEFASQSYGDRYDAAKYGHIYDDERYYASGSARRTDDSEIWSRGRTYGLFLPEEKSRVLRISPEGISTAGILNTRARLVDLNSPEAARLMDDIHRFTAHPGVVLLGPDIERLLGPFGYSWRDRETQSAAAFDIEEAYKKSLQGRVLNDPNATVAQRWDESLSRRGFYGTNLEQAAYDSQFFHSESEFNSEYIRRQGEYQKKFDACGHSGPRDYECRDAVDAEYYPVRAAREDRQLRQDYQQYQGNIDSVVNSGAIATGARAAGYFGARLLGQDEDEALAISETTATIGGFADTLLPVKAAFKTNTAMQNYKAGGGNILTRDAQITLQLEKVPAPPTNEPVAPPTKTADSTAASNAVGETSVGTMPRNVDLTGKAPVPTTFGPTPGPGPGSGGSPPPPPAPKPVYPQTTGPLRMEFNLKYVNTRGDLTKEGIEFLKREYPQKFVGLDDQQMQTAFQAERTGRMWEKMVVDEIAQTVPKPARGAKGRGQPFVIQNKNFNNTVAELEKKVPGSVTDKSPLKQSVKDFIKGNADLQKLAKNLETSKNSAVRDEWVDWIEKNENGIIGQRIPDALEVIPGRNLGVFYDPALPVNSPFGNVHGFKTELYRQVLLKITTMDVGAIDIGLGVINLTGD